MIILGNTHLLTLLTMSPQKYGSYRCNWSMGLGPGWKQNMLNVRKSSLEKRSLC